MANKTQTIRIESILGGHGDFGGFSAPNQFLSSVGINPYLPSTDSEASFNCTLPSGMLRPVPVHPMETIIGVDRPLWMVPVETGNTEATFLYNAVGSVYSLFSNLVSEVGDLTDGGTAQGNGADYYDNFVYFSRTTTIARYGPVGTSGTSPTFTDDYWATTLGKTALNSKSFPLDKGASGNYTMPNHVLHRHSDGKLYIADVVDNQGTLHYIKTTKTTYEGDTDNGSKYDALHFGYNLFLTSIESYGESLALSLYESESIYQTNMRARVAFWDTTSEKANIITTNEFSDSFITASKNVNGKLYFFSKNIFQSGFRISQYLGGTSFQVVKHVINGDSPHNGAVLTLGDKLYFSSSSIRPGGSRAYSVFMLDTSTGALFSVFPVHYSTTSPITSIAFDNSPANSGGLDRPGLVAGAGNSIFTETTDYSLLNAGQSWTSQVYKIGSPYKITKISFPLAQTISANMTVNPVIYTDDGNGRTYTGGSTNGLATISNTLYSGKNYISMMPQNMTGNYNFYLTLNWSGSALCTINLPITIEYELIDD